MTTIFITAANPMYRQLTLRANDARMYQLLHDLGERVPQKNIRATKFIDKSKGYTEDGFRVVGLSISDAIFLARYYGQQSILIDGKGLLDVNTMMLAPEVGKHTGLQAMHRTTYTSIERLPPVSYDLDFDHQVRFKP